MRFWIALGLGLATLSAARPAEADDRAALLATMHVDRMSPFRITMVIKHGSETSVQDITILGPGRQADYLPQMHQTDVTIGERTWIRKDDGTWSGPTATPDYGSAALRDRAGWIRRTLARSTVTALGTGVLDGVKVAHYRILTTGRISHKVRITDLWLGIADGFPRRTVMKIGGDTISDTFSAFGQRLPIPTPP